VNIKLAEALLRRKELQQKVDQLKSINQQQLFEVKVKRQKVSDDIDDILAQVPKLTASQVTREYDYYARALRLCDAAIQQANWTADVAVGDEVMAAFKD
jgi:hypothetical protein